MLLERMKIVEGGRARGGGRGSKVVIRKLPQIIGHFVNRGFLWLPLTVGELVHEITMITAPQNLVAQLITMITAPQNLVVQLITMITAPQNLVVHLILGLGRISVLTSLKTSQDKTRQDKSRQDKTSLKTTRPDQTHHHIKILWCSYHSY